MISMLDKTFLDLYIAVLHMEPGGDPMSVGFERYTHARRSRKKLRGHLVDIGIEEEYVMSTKKQGHSLYIERRIVE